MRDQLKRGAQSCLKEEKKIVELTSATERKAIQNNDSQSQSSLAESRWTRPVARSLGWAPRMWSSTRNSSDHLMTGCCVHTALTSGSHKRTTYASYVRLTASYVDTRLGGSKLKSVGSCSQRERAEGGNVAMVSCPPPKGRCLHK